MSILCLQATWNGHVASVAMLLSAKWPDGSVNPWASRMNVNQLLRTPQGSHFSELDLALMKRYVDSSRVLGGF